MAKSDIVFMTDDSLLSEIVSSASLHSGDSVLEVGGGRGALTERLIGHVPVTVLEKDPGLYAALQRRFHGDGRVRVVRGDAVRMKYPPYNKVVSNIPYSVSRELLERFILEGFELAVLVVQREFALKLAAEPAHGNYRMLSVLAQTTCDVEYLRDIPPESFTPKPKVASSLIRLRQRWKPGEEYISFLNTLFSRKNKKMRNIMEAPAQYRELRPVGMKPEEFLRLYRALGGAAG